MKCACGCDELIKAGNRFVHGHNWRGRNRTDEDRDKKRATWTPQRRKAQSESRLEPEKRAVLDGARRIDGVAWHHGRAYIQVQNHPSATYPGGRVARARIVAEFCLGRLLDPKEHVHHVNENITDDEPANLMILTASEHAKIHSKGNLAKRWGKIV
jgi:hypothetical protein